VAIDFINAYGLGDLLGSRDEEERLTGPGITMLVDDEAQVLRMGHFEKGAL